MDLFWTGTDLPPPPNYIKMMQAIQNNLYRALNTVVTRHNIKMDTSIYAEIWETMLSETTPAPAPEVEVAESVDETVENTKLTPLQRAEKQVTTTTEKLDKIRARQGTAKQTQKQKEKDPEDIRKLEEKLKEATAKLEKLAPKVAAPAPAPAPEKKVNMAKWTPTWKKHYEAAGNKPEQKEEFMQYINAMTETVYNASSYEAHAKAFANVKAPAPTAPVPEPAEDEEVTEIEYDGETYVVGDVSGKVWKVDEETEVDVPVHDLDTIKAVVDKLNSSK
jgi:hypothetical protein